jgi:hypothetical protein
MSQKITATILALPKEEQIKEATRAYIKHQIDRTTFDWLINEIKNKKESNGQLSLDSSGPLSGKDQAARNQ